MKPLVALAFVVSSSFACGSTQGPEGPSVTSDPAPSPPLPPATSSSPPATSSSPPTSPQQSVPMTAQTSTLTASSNHFGLDLWGRVRSTPGNLAVSPASIWVALAMTQSGARASTATEMATVMHLPAGDDIHRLAGRVLASWNDASRTTYTLRVANRLFGERTYRCQDEYVRTTREVYGAPLEPLDFAHGFDPARVHINGWVAEQTSDRIRDLLPSGSLDADTRLVLVNALYFLGRWADPFQRAQTRDVPFFVTASQSMPVPTMHRRGHIAYAELDGVQLVELPYVGDELSMIVVVPRARAGLAAVEASLDSSRLARWTSGLTPTLVMLALPKFTIDPPQSVRLGDTLQAMGMRAAFSATAADFTGIADPPRPADRLYISQVFHKAFVRVDEEGTEAAAATAVSMARGGGMPRPEQPIVVSADHPFLFLLRDMRSGMVLFMGRVADPRGR